MIPLSITADIDRDPWRDLPRDQIVNPEQMATIERVGLLRHGTVEGRATVSLAIRLPDGRYVLAETSARLANLAVRALQHSPVLSEEDLP